MSNYTHQKYDLVRRKDFDELTATIEGAMASQNARLRSVADSIAQQDQQFVAVYVELGNLRQELTEFEINVAKTLLSVSQRIDGIDNRRFTVRVRALLGRIKAWKRNGLPRSLSVGFSSPPSPLPSPIDSGIDKAWTRDSEQYPIF